MTYAVLKIATHTLAIRALRVIIVSTLYYSMAIACISCTISLSPLI
jgi:hypothetical protein